MELLGLSLSVVNNPLNALALSIMWLAIYMAFPGVGIGFLLRYIIGLERKIAALIGIFAASIGAIYWFRETFF